MNRDNTFMSYPIDVLISAFLGLFRARMDLADQSRIRGRLVLITGASGGIGGACAKILATEGAKLALTYSKNKEKLDNLVKDIRASNCDDIEISTHRVDFANVDEIHALLKEVQLAHNQPVEILVANAGYGKKIVDIEDVDLGDFEYAHQVNVRAPYLLVKGVVGDMKQRRWGRIIFVSSIAAYGGGINGCHYAASKGGVTGMAKNLAARLAQYNISVNDVAPAMIGDTGILPNPVWIPEVIRNIPLGRLGKPEEVAEVVRMFAKTGYVTGQSIIAGGGLR